MASCPPSSAGHDKRGCPVSAVKNNLNHEPRPSQKGNGAQTPELLDSFLLSQTQTEKRTCILREGGRKRCLCSGVTEQPAEAAWAFVLLAVGGTARVIRPGSSLVVYAVSTELRAELSAPSINTYPSSAKHSAHSSR